MGVLDNGGAAATAFVMRDLAEIMIGDGTNRSAIQE